MGINDKVRYVVTMPGGDVITRDSQKHYTHVAVAETNEPYRHWQVLGYFGSRELAEGRKATHDGLWPQSPAVVLPVVPTVPLTESQRAFLLEIGDRTIEMLGTTHVVALVNRGFLHRQPIGMRWWKVRRTRAGKMAVAAFAAPDPVAESSSEARSAEA